MRTLTLLLLLAASTAALAAGPASIDNDDSCDISLLPAATLLLPYFEVDFTAPAGTGETTIFTLTNVSELPQIAQVTLWTDFEYPVLAFNIFLTGYDVQSINLYDVIRRGQIAPDEGTGLDVSHVGELSGNFATQKVFDNPLVNEQSCTDLPVQLPQSYINRMQSVFTTGKLPALGSSPGCNTAGAVHTNAIGYATVDVVNACGARLPTEPGYFANVIGFDNVLGGDYMQVNGNEDFAQGSAMVHIRAIPEGGTGQTRAANAATYAVRSPRTFYSRFQHSTTPRFDARQPLPATFAARWISGGATGFETYYKIWREGRSPAATPCSAYPGNASMGFVDAVLFDEEENPETLAPDIVICTPIPFHPTLPAASLVSVSDESVFPPNTLGAVAGWMYMNLDYCTRDDFASQNWVVTSMRAEDRFSVDIDAMALGNGCSAPVAASNAIGGVKPIGPAPNVRE